MDKISRIKELVYTLNEASKLYYNGQQSNLTDKEWDSMFDELKALEQETDYILSNSPTQTIGFQVVDELEKVQHIKPMLSLDKTKDIEVLKQFLGNNIGILSWKLDGLTIVLTYENGILVDAVTRGNGTIGSKILHNALVFDNIPKTIQYKGKLVVRGEGLISKEDFNTININGEYSNPRNLASGSIMQLDSKIAKERHLKFITFGIVECDKKINTIVSQFIWLKEQGFDVVLSEMVDRNNIENVVEYFNIDIEDYDFATDGLVLVYNDIAYGESLGYTNHHYNNGIAFKWQDTTVETTLKDIDFQVGRTGVVTPVAIFEPIDIDGAIVEKASIHNLSILKSLKLGIGDTITVYRANMVIPQIAENLTQSNTFVIPTQCPCCGSGLSIEKTDIAEKLMCKNDNCQAKMVAKLSHYVSRDAMNIDGFSEKTIEKFHNKGILYDITDIYTLKYELSIKKMEGFGAKSYNNLIDAIEKSKTCKLENFIYALGIPNVGKNTAKLLVNYFKGEDSIDTLSRIMEATVDDITKINDCGLVVAENINSYFKNMCNINIVNYVTTQLKFIDDLKEKVIATNNPLKGKVVYCTGKFKVNKDTLKEKLSVIGCEYASGYKKSLDYLITGEDTSKSGKVDKAINDGVKVMGFQELYDILGI